MNTIGAKIKQIRNAYGYTQKDFGSFLGVSDAHISKIEAGKDFPSKALVQIMCTKFNVGEAWLTDEKSDSFILQTNDTLKNNFLELLAEHKMNEVSVLNNIGISSSDFFLLERGNPNTDLNTLVKISDYFDVSLDWLIKGKEHAVFYSSDLNMVEVNLLKEFRSLDEDEKVIVRGLIQKLVSNKIAT